jgi:hypothetical protein
MLTKKLLVAAACVAMLFSCSKDDKSDTNPNTDPGKDSIPTVNAEQKKLLGTWTFVNLVAETNTTLTIENEKSVTITNYTTLENTGVITITADSLNTDNFGYKVNTWTFNAYYVDNMVEDTFSLPFQFTAEKYSSKSKYKWISKDSLYGESGTTTTGSTTVKSIPAGIKLGWSGDTLLMITKLDTISKQLLDGGYYADKRQIATTTTKLVKK